MSWWQDWGSNWGWSGSGEESHGWWGEKGEEEPAAERTAPSLAEAVAVAQAAPTEAVATPAGAGLPQQRHQLPKQPEHRQPLQKQRGLRPKQKLHPSKQQKQRGLQQNHREPQHQQK
jgi:hypothetical protein